MPLDREEFFPVEKKDDTLTIFFFLHQHAVARYAVRTLIIALGNDPKPGQFLRRVFDRLSPAYVAEAPGVNRFLSGHSAERKREQDTEDTQ